MVKLGHLYRLVARRQSQILPMSRIFEEPVGSAKGIVEELALKVDLGSGETSDSTSRLCSTERMQSRLGKSGLQERRFG